MLHTGVIENKGGFRALDAAELEAVSGGYVDEDPIPGGGTGGFGPQAEYFSATGLWVDDPVIAEHLVSSMSGGGFNAEGGATPSPIVGTDSSGENFILLFVGSVASDADNGSGGVTTASDFEDSSFGCNVIGGLVGLGLGIISLPGAILVTGPGGPWVAGALGVIGGSAAIEACEQ